MTASARIYPHGHEPGADTSRDLVRELLFIGRERVARPGGWTQGALIYQSASAVNVIGALQIPDRQSWFDLAIQDQALDALYDALPLRWRGFFGGERTWLLAYWNNAPWRQQQQVVELFDKAIRSRDNG